MGLPRTTVTLFAIASMFPLSSTARLMIVTFPPAPDEGVVHV
jgi:hypothetical protein